MVVGVVASVIAIGGLLYRIVSAVQEYLRGGIAEEDVLLIKECLAVALVSLFVAVAWTVFYFLAFVNDLPDQQPVPCDDIYFVFQYILLCSLIIGWLALLISDETFYRLVVAFILALVFWIIELCSSEFLGEVALIGQLRTMLGYSSVLALLTAPLSVYLGCELVSEFWTPTE